MKIFETEHYIFNYGENSCAEKDIEKNSRYAGKVFRVYLQHSQNDAVF